MVKKASYNGLKWRDELPKFSQKSPQVVKHVVKGEKRACTIPTAGKNKPIRYISKTRGLDRFPLGNKRQLQIRFTGR